MLVPGNRHQRPNVVGQILLLDRREHHLHVRRRSGVARRQDAQVSEERQVVERHPDLRQSGRGRQRAQ